jgi:methionyl-tRNA formyltransferase
MIGTVLFIADKSDISRVAADVVTLNASHVTSLHWDYGDPRADTIASAKSGIDWILSFKSDVLLTAAEVKTARLGAINFHPAPPWYRGIGGYDYAIQRKERRFGVTCHYMNERIDAGPIIGTSEFAISPDETPNSLKQTCGLYCLRQLLEVLKSMASGTPPGFSSTKWSGPLHTRAELAASLLETGAIALQDAYPTAVSR